jgi:hypothetical protein
MALPHQVQKEHIYKAMDSIDKSPTSVPLGQKIKKYELRRGRGKYPPKFVIRKAYSFLGGSDFPNIFGGGTQANNFLIKRGFKIWDRVNGKPVTLEAVDEDPEKIFAEGNVLFEFRKHKSIERDRALPKHAKNQRMKTDSKLHCEVCNFSFVETYGDVGEGFIEAHHLVPLTRVLGRRHMRVADIALVCSNCHRMLHQSNPLAEPSELRNLVRSRRRMVRSRRRK